MMVTFEFVGIALYFAVALCLSVVILFASFICGNQKWNPEKSSAYECGFDPFVSSEGGNSEAQGSGSFNVQFYLVAILFMIFDLEVAFLFPWAVSLRAVSKLDSQIGFWSMMVFLGLLTIGFVYEWSKGALDW